MSVTADEKSAKVSVAHGRYLMNLTLENSDKGMILCNTEISSNNKRLLGIDLRYSTARHALEIVLVNPKGQRVATTDAIVLELEPIEALSGKDWLSDIDVDDLRGLIASTQRYMPPPLEVIGGVGAGDQLGGADLGLAAEVAGCNRRCAQAAALQLAIAAMALTATSMVPGGFAVALITYAVAVLAIMAQMAICMEACSGSTEGDSSLA